MKHKLATVDTNIKIRGASLFSNSHISVIFTLNAVTITVTIYMLSVTKF